LETRRLLIPVRGIAERTAGIHEFVDDPAHISDAVIRALSDTLRIVLTNISVVSRCGDSYQSMLLPDVYILFIGEAPPL
jgi:hypothetical protein